MIHPLNVSSASEVGLVRKNNQDAYHVYKDDGLVVVADGMGGHNGGEIASSIAVTGICDNLLQQQWDDESDEMQTLLKLGAAVEHANQLIRQEASMNADLSGMGTTVVTALFRESRVYMAHVGDSRIYRFRDNCLQQLTRDHSLVQQLVDAGTFVSVKEAEAAGIGSNVLTRGLGIEDQVEVDVTDEELLPGDLFMFCTDGLTNMITDHDIGKILEHYRGDLNMATERLTLGALSAGGLDNVTLVLAEPMLQTA